LNVTTPNGTYIWQDGSVLPYLLVTKDGEYSVMVKDDCDSSSGQVQITFIECECEYYIPSAFTPNHDNVNDSFGVVNECHNISNYKLEIYNRLGELMFISVNPMEKWDGTCESVPSQMDSYIYILSYRHNQQDYYKKGSCVLIR
jgi:gliding motility-associated-like protein